MSKGGGDKLCGRLSGTIPGRKARTRGEASERLKWSELEADLKGWVGGTERKGTRTNGKGKGLLFP